MVLIYIPSYQAEGAELRSTETEGSITFTGGPYVSVNEPNPAPPAGAIPLPPASSNVPPSTTPANIPSGKLPQTSFNDLRYSFWIGLILLLLSVAVAYKSFKEESINKEINRNHTNKIKYKKVGMQA